MTKQNPQTERRFQISCLGGGETSESPVCTVLWKGCSPNLRRLFYMERRFSNLRLLMERRLLSLLWYRLRALPIPDPAESKRGICLFGAMRLNLNPRRAAGTAEIAQRFKLLYTEIYRDNSTEQLFSLLFLLFSCPKIYDARAKATSCFSCSPVRKSMMREPRRPPVSPVLLSSKIRTVFDRRTGATGDFVS